LFMKLLTGVFGLTCVIIAMKKRGIMA